MKSALKLFVAVFFILAAVRVVEAQEYTVTGKVRYADNNEIVTSGVVKLFDSNGNLIGASEINYSGDYILGPHRIITGQTCDLIGFPNIEPEEDYVPTGYPDKVEPSLFVHLSITQNLTGVDIYVQRSLGALRPGVTTSLSGIVLSNNVPVSDAVIYAKQGGEYVGFGVSNAKGEYKINNLPVGDYILVAHKVGTQSESRFVTITENGNSNFSFALTPKAGNLVNNNPFEFALSQNYPNPFNPNTVISYSIAAEGNVTLKVFNSAGQQVSELVNANQSAGIYNVEFNASSLSSGVYFYRLDANGFTATNKMILVK